MKLGEHETRGGHEICLTAHGEPMRVCLYEEYVAATHVHIYIYIYIYSSHRQRRIHVYYSHRQRRAQACALVRGVRCRTHVFSYVAPNKKNIKKKHNNTHSSALPYRCISYVAPRSAHHVCVCVCVCVCVSHSAVFTFENCAISLSLSLLSLSLSLSLSLCTHTHTSICGRIWGASLIFGRTSSLRMALRPAAEMAEKTEMAERSALRPAAKEVRKICVYIPLSFACARARARARSLSRSLSLCDALSLSGCVCVSGCFAEIWGA